MSLSLTGLEGGLWDGDTLVDQGHWWIRDTGGSGTLVDQGHAGGSGTLVDQGHWWIRDTGESGTLADN